MFIAVIQTLAFRTLSELSGTELSLNLIFIPKEMWEVKSSHSKKGKAFFPVWFAAIMSKGNSGKNHTLKKH